MVIYVLLTMYLFFAQLFGTFAILPNDVVSVPLLLQLNLITFFAAKLCFELFLVAFLQRHDLFSPFASVLNLLQQFVFFALQHGDPVRQQSGVVLHCVVGLLGLQQLHVTLFRVLCGGVVQFL